MSDSSSWETPRRFNFLHDYREWGLGVAWFNLRFNLAWWLLGKPSRMRVTPRKDNKDAKTRHKTK